MKKITSILLLTLSLFVSAQQTIALLEPRIDAGSVSVSNMEKNMVRGELRKAIVNLSGFEAITRNDIDQMMQEQNFQRTGMVSSAQIKRLGELSGADYICVSTLTKSDAEFYLEAYLIHLESGRMSNPASQYGELTNGKLANLFPACQALARDLMNDKNIYTQKYTSKNKDYIEKDINLKMIWVEGGEFMMGCTSEQNNICIENEKNIRRVKVDGFYIGMFEVTQQQYIKIMESNPSITTSPTSTLPVENINWYDAMTFCNKLSNYTGKTYTLPTEAQWEYAARGGNKSKGTKYSGSNLIDAVAWYTDNIDFPIIQTCGSKHANELGIYDMSGNVSEWCKDWYIETYITSDTDNPTGPHSGKERVARGGNWTSEPWNCYVWDRDYYEPDYHNADVGFRVVCIP